MSLGSVLTLVTCAVLLDNVISLFWLRWSLAAALGILVPAITLNNLLPRDELIRPLGLYTDILTVIWTVFPLFVMIIAPNFTAAALIKQAQQVETLGAVAPARGIAWLARIDDRPPTSYTLKGSKTAFSGTALTDAVAAAETDPTEEQRVAEPSSARSTYDKARSALVLVRVTAAESTQDATRVTSAAGLLLGRDSLVVTHRVDDGTSIEIQSSDRAWISAARRVARDEQRGLSWLRLSQSPPDASVYTSITLRKSPLRIGEPIHCIGMVTPADPIHVNGDVTSLPSQEPGHWASLNRPLHDSISCVLFDDHAQVIGFWDRSGYAHAIATLQTPVSRQASQNEPATLRTGHGPGATKAPPSRMQNPTAADERSDGGIPAQPENTGTLSTPSSSATPVDARPPTNEPANIAPSPNTAREPADHLPGQPADNQQQSPPREDQ